jgi:ubiquitin carboxyl-terminal hydrolase 34
MYHKDFIAEYGPRFVDVCTRALREAPEKSLRDMRRERIESIIKSIDSFQRRIISKDEREKMTEVVKLEVALMCLKSSFLERRIQGIRDLNGVIRNNRMFNSKTFTAKFLIEWMEQNGVYSQIFDTRKTHIQLV